jgi:hypothetical protein
MHLLNNFILIFQVRDPFFLPDLLGIAARRGGGCVMSLRIVLIVAIEEIEKIPS